MVTVACSSGSDVSEQVLHLVLDLHRERIARLGECSVTATCPSCTAMRSTTEPVTMSVPVSGWTTVPKQFLDFFLP